MRARLGLSADLGFHSGALSLRNLLWGPFFCEFRLTTWGWLYATRSFSPPFYEIEFLLLLPGSACGSLLFVAAYSWQQRATLSQLWASALSSPCSGSEPPHGEGCWQELNAGRAAACGHAIESALAPGVSMAQSLPDPWETLRAALSLRPSLLPWPPGVCPGSTVALSTQLKG